jgi:hypothetical protein
MEVALIVMPWSMPAIVLIITAAAHAPTSSLAQVAMNESLRRLITPPAQLRLNTIDIPPPMPGPPEPPAPAKDDLASAAVKLGKDPAEAEEAAKKAKEDIGDENSWRLKMSGARAALDQDQVLYDAMQSRINALVADFASRDDPAQRAEIERQRIRALDELDRLKKQIQKDTETISAIEEDARKKGIPPGWIR